MLPMVSGVARLFCSVAAFVEATPTTTLPKARFAGERPTWVEWATKKLQIAALLELR
jgi:hypothetical protein